MQMTKNEVEADMHKMVKKVMAVLKRSWMDWNRQMSCLNIAKSLVADAEYQAYKATEAVV